MTYSRTFLTIGALLIGAGFIVAAFLASRPIMSPVSAESTAELLKAYAAKDTDGDMLPDWQEALYGTDPADPRSVQASMTDAEAVANGLVVPLAPEVAGTTVDGSVPTDAPASDSLTERFGRIFLERYIATRGSAPPSPEEAAAFVADAINDLRDMVPDEDAYAAASLIVSESGADALRTYAAISEGAFAAHTVAAKKSEILYFSDAVRQDDAGALAEITAIGTAYENIAEALSKIAVPREGATVHLALVNALARIGRISGDLAALKSDPLRAALGLSRYEDAVRSLQTASSDITNTFRDAGVSFVEGNAGYYFARVGSVQESP